MPVEMQTSNRLDLSTSSVLTLSNSLNEPEWMKAKRLHCWTLYNKFEPPFKKFNNISNLDVSNYNVNVERTLPEDIAPVESFGKRNGIQIQQNGLLARMELDETLKKAGVIFTDMHSALRERPELVQKYFLSQIVQPKDNKLVSLHSAFWKGGVFVYVPKGVTVELPLQAISNFEMDGEVLSPHYIIIADEMSRVTFIDTLIGRGNSGEFVNNVVEIIAQQGAQISYICLQELGINTVHSAFKRAVVKKDASIRWFEIGFGSKISNVNVETFLTESGANAELLGLYFAESNQQLEYDTLQLHKAPNCNSDLLYKGALRDSAYTRFNGVIRVNKGSQKTNAYQANKNLILSQSAHVDTIPQLEIEANDVRCTHGATVGPISAEDLFYLTSRGIDKETAIKLLAIGFFSQVLDRIEIEDLKSELVRYIEHHITK